MTHRTLPGRKGRSPLEEGKGELMEISVQEARRRSRVISYIDALHERAGLPAVDFTTYEEILEWLEPVLTGEEIRAKVRAKIFQIAELQKLATHDRP